MLRAWKQTVYALSCAFALSTVSLAAPQSGSTGISVVFSFPPIADCGTVGTVTSFFDLDGDGQLDECPVWFADQGGAYLVAGIENYDVGDRVFVEGLICTTCLTTCPASAILFSTISDCPPKGGKGGKNKSQAGSTEARAPLSPPISGGRAGLQPGFVFASGSLAPGSVGIGPAGTPGSHIFYPSALDPVTAGMDLGLPGAPAGASASTSVSLIPFLFPPIAGCGTVGTVQSFYDLDGDGQLDDCTVWFADQGGAYLVGGLESFDVGDRVFVEGLICTTCLTTCPAGAILFGVISTPCPDGGK